jgi:adenine-specific DNA-methyltransferase
MPAKKSVQKSDIKSADSEKTPSRNPNPKKNESIKKDLDPTDEYVYQTMLTCIGNKRKLVKHIYEAAKDVCKNLKKDKLKIMDGFAGSCVVSRQLSYLASEIWTNDLEKYSYLMARCNLITPSSADQERIYNHIDVMNKLALEGPFIENGIISRLYAPKITTDIKEGERCFYTRENALIIDTLRDYIEKNVEENLKVYCLVPLLCRASIHANTAGVFKGFYKKNGIGHFGGTGENALERIMAQIRLDYPVWNNNNKFNAFCSQRDINELIEEAPYNNDTMFDLIYLDPPYNQHPYGSNYFMLNIIADNKEPTDISKVSGIPSDWNKSVYNKSGEAIEFMTHLLDEGLRKSRYLLISYNNEGIISDAEWDELLKHYTVKKYEIKYDTYKGSRNLGDRNDKVLERMFLVSRT